MQYNQDEKRKIIMNHYLKPENLNKDLNEIDNITRYGETCGDTLNIDLEIKNETIKNISFNGQGCAIFISATDILINLLKNKNISEVKNIIEIYHNLIDGKDLNIEELVKIGELAIYNNIDKSESRKRCAKMASELILQQIKNAK
ncbi:iron-sulfur cluster assembly scaffold protein [Mycoplasmopsis hyopharyngis]|uniref:iron-sulfur cluster assembly scaffold protein n=1 Tax=Mycoplasmopsis hyopharyngis TaxID=29558 RepID=UPI00387376DC